MNKTFEFMNSASAAAIFAGIPKFGPQIVFDQPEPRSGASDPVNDDPKPAEPAKSENEPSDEDKKLLKEVMKKKERIEALEAQLKQFEGIDPAEFRKLTSEKKEAEKAKKEAEKKAAEAAGDFDRVKQMMLEEHKKELDAERAVTEELRKALKDREREIDDLTIGQTFAASNFVREELVLTPNKARVVYGAHFSREEGKLVAYDKPDGESNRTKLVDSRGEALSFDAALRKIVEADSDRDHVLKSKLQIGANSKTTNDKGNKTEEVTELRGVARINALIAKNGFGGNKK
jgi:vacuolar-type H+-ATPase subunit I/STV1